MNNAEISSIMPLVLERAVDHHRCELPNDLQVLDRLFRYLETTRPFMAEVKACVCEFYHLKPFEITGRYRQCETALARQIFYYLAFRYTRNSSAQIGRYVGRDHSTVLHGIRKIEKNIITKPLLADDIDLLRLRISEKMLLRKAAQ